jgi:hypothetical protein
MGLKELTATLMSTKNSSTSTTLLIVLMMIITFPFWIAIGGVAIGLIAAVFGVVFGILGAILGGLFALIALPFKLIFGWGEWSCNFPSFHGNGFVWLALLIFAALVITKRSRN